MTVQNHQCGMIQGAGTISEKQFYTYTDTTAQPNVVYYYQIEDVSLDGNRQTLTNGTRLKGAYWCGWQTHDAVGRLEDTRVNSGIFLTNLPETRAVDFGSSLWFF